jgi:hypothetical protein
MAPLTGLAGNGKKKRLGRQAKALRKGEAVAKATASSSATLFAVVLVVAVLLVLLRAAFATLLVVLLALAFATLVVVLVLLAFATLVVLVVLAHSVVSWGIWDGPAEAGPFRWSAALGAWSFRRCLLESSSPSSRLALRAKTVAAA